MDFTDKSHLYLISINICVRKLYVHGHNWYNEATIDCICIIVQSCAGLSIKDEMRPIGRVQNWMGKLLEEMCTDLIITG